MHKHKRPSNPAIKRVNIVLLVIIVLCNGYVILAPLRPKFNYEVQQRITKPVQVDPADPIIDTSKNHLVIPALQMDEPIYDGTDQNTVHRGVWRRPQTSTPEKGSNTVLVGHRFTYNGPAVFFNLDKLQPSDDVYVAYDKKLYHYRVEAYKIVPPTAVDIEAPTDESLLTIYTCTPLLTAKDRLVYTAKLMEVR